MRIFFIFIFLISNLTAFSQNQALTQLVYEIRNPQTDSTHFRQALETIGQYLALNVLEDLNTQEKTIQTLTGVDALHYLVDEVPVLVTILRGGLPLNDGIHRVFPNASVGFLAMSRNEETLKATIDYIALPEIKGRCVILSDTMIATGGSLIDALQVIEQYEPKKIYVITAVAAEPGLKKIFQYNPNIKIFAAVVDPFLNEKGYIIPGLGDAGDRSFGEKHFLHSIDLAFEE